MNLPPWKLEVLMQANLHDDSSSIPSGTYPKPRLDANAV